MKKVLITGGHGDIAQALRAELEALGEYEVRTPGKDELDVTSPESAAEYIAGYIPNVLVNNAGFVVPARIAEADIAREKLSLDINLFGVFNCTNAVLKLNPNARVVTVGSSAASKVHGTWSSYCAGKAGVVMATKCWAEDGVDTVCISPGRTRTKMRDSLYHGEDPETLLDPADFAKVLALAVDGAYMPGTHINVNVGNIAEVLAKALGEQGERSRDELC